VYCYGLLYHLQDPDTFLESISRRCSSLLLLETCVSVGDYEAINPIAEPNIPSQAFHGVGCRPTRPWVFNRLKELFAHAYVPRTQPAHEQFPIDWTAAEPSSSLTRAVFIGSRHALANSKLLESLPDMQSRE
jgi:hypothetical protein